jgi:segregation and condensation protein A
MYKIKLRNFEGPFDLLLYFIKRDELDIYDIPISRITEEFLNYVQMMQLLDLELAGEFLVMAANLMLIKTQMLLPRNNDREDGEAEDPRTDLINQLIEYKQMKEASKELGIIAEEQKFILYRNLFDEDRKLAKDSTEPQYKGSTVFDLVRALRKALSRSEMTLKPHLVKRYAVSIEERSEWLLTTLREKKRISFMDILMNESRPVIVVTFLSILELIKERKIFVFQSDSFGNIIITEKPAFNLN